MDVSGLRHLGLGFGCFRTEVFRTEIVVFSGFRYLGLR